MPRLWTECGRVWLSDGRRLLFVRGEGEICLFDTESGQTHLVLPVGITPTEAGRRFSISKDDRWLSFTETKNEGDVWLLSFEQQSAWSAHS